MSRLVHLYRRFAHIVHELAKFGSIGAISAVITFGVGNALHLGFGLGELTSTGIATVIAATFAYVANRYWTFRHRDQSGLGREYVIFFALNGVGLLITWLFQGAVKFGLEMRGPVAYNVSLVIGTAAATLFRYWSYKRWVFLPAEDGADTGAQPVPGPLSRPTPQGQAEFSRPTSITPGR
ncbi:GtrA family protein [Actinomadura rayongensis]|uniref:GtrA family protein n=1 Tax=Actinomadura rayongensis TaxID=1429076 RepID=A0A6I4W5E5_9ACTN|nr:GtrA family protein [Actinomadura rayongensis]